MAIKAKLAIASPVRREGIIDIKIGSNDDHRGMKLLVPGLCLRVLYIKRGPGSFMPAILDYQLWYQGTHQELAKRG